MSELTFSSIANTTDPSQRSALIQRYLQENPNAAQAFMPQPSLQDHNRVRDGVAKDQENAARPTQLGQSIAASDMDNLKKVYGVLGLDPENPDHQSSIRYVQDAYTRTGGDTQAITTDVNNKLRGKAWAGNTDGLLSNTAEGSLPATALSQIGASADNIAARLGISPENLTNSQNTVFRLPGRSNNGENRYRGMMDSTARLAQKTYGKDVGDFGSVSLKNNVFNAVARQAAQTEGFNPGVLLESVELAHNPRTLSIAAQSAGFQNPADFVKALNNAKNPEAAWTSYYFQTYKNFGALTSGQ